MSKGCRKTTLSLLLLTKSLLELFSTMVSKVFKGLAVLLVTILLLLLVGEAFIRYLQDRTKPPTIVRQRDEFTHHSLKPNTTDIARSPEWETELKINSLGMRDKEYSVEKPENTFRVLMLGDSFTEGQGVKIEQTFSKLLEKSLGEKIKNKKIEVMNAGVLSYSPLLEYQYLKYRGLRLKPDLVILDFDQGDIIDDRWYDSELVRDDKGLPLKFKAPDTTTNQFAENQALPWLPLSVKEFFHSNSRLYMVVTNSVKSKRLILYPEIIDVIPIPGNPGRDKLIATRDQVENYDELWRLSKQNLRLIRDLLKENNTNFLIVDYPYAHQVSAAEWKAGRKKLFFEEKVYDNDREFKTLAQFTKEEGINYHSTLADFRAETRKPLYFDSDGHWNLLGHEVMANSIEKYLLNSNLLPK